MRTFFTFFSLILFLIVSIPFIFILKFIGIFNKRFCASVSQKIVNGAFKLVMFCAGIRIKVVGLENVPDCPCLFTANHRSYADVPIGYTTVPHLTGFIAKKQIKKVPSLSWWMTNMNCLFLDRDDMRQGLKTIISAIDNIKAGYSVFVMPEGTRNHEPEMLPFKEGTYKIALKSGCPVIPVAMTNTDHVYELHAPWVKATDVVIHYGKPIYPKDLTPDESKVLGATVRGIIADMLAEDAQYFNEKGKFIAS